MELDQRSRIEAFWAWFEGKRIDLASPQPSDQTIAELDRRLADLGVRNWELGPGTVEANSLIISPGGEADRLGLVTEIVDSAPLVKGWEWHHAKPPKNWKLRFEMDISGRQVTIDGHDWEFLLYRFKDRTYDIVFHPLVQQGLSKDDLLTAAFTLLDGELGEEARINLFGAVEVVSGWGTEPIEKVRRLEAGLLRRLVR